MSIVDILNSTIHGMKGEKLLTLSGFSFEVTILSKFKLRKNPTPAKKTNTHAIHIIFCIPSLPQACLEWSCALLYSLFWYKTAQQNHILFDLSSLFFAF